MNIFVTDLCPKQSAFNAPDKHASKMPLEVAQMLSSAIRKNTILPIPNTITFQFLFKNFLKNDPNNILWLLVSDLPIYKLAHSNHPCTVWVSENISNFNWCYEYGIALCQTYFERYDKIHSSLEIIKRCQSIYSKHLPQGSQTEFAMAINNDAITSLNLSVVESYRLFLAHKHLTKIRFTKTGKKICDIVWERCEKPEWLEACLKNK